MNEFNKLFKHYDAIVFFDTETTGVEHHECQIIELAAQRIKRSKDGSLEYITCMDSFIKLPKGEVLPEKIIELTGITDAQLTEYGISEKDAVDRFLKISKREEGALPTLLVAHNAQFDLLFLQDAIKRCYPNMTDPLSEYGKLDSLTVYRDRRGYPNKLANAIEDYKLGDAVKNSHRAIDDVLALVEVCKAMDAERADLDTYINIFGTYPKHGLSGKPLSGVSYVEQPYCQFMKRPSETLPAMRQRTSPKWDKAQISQIVANMEENKMTDLKTLLFEKTAAAFRECQNCPARDHQSYQSYRSVFDILFNLIDESGLKDEYYKWRGLDNIW